MAVIGELAAPAQVSRYTGLLETHTAFYLPGDSNRSYIHFLTQPGIASLRSSFRNQQRAQTLAISTSLSPL